MTLDEARGLVGTTVIYRSGTGRPAPAKVEAVNTHWVYVRFTGARNAQAVAPQYLTASGPARVTARSHR